MTNKNNYNKKNNEAPDAYKSSLDKYKEREELRNYLLLQAESELKQLETIAPKRGRKAHKPSPELRLYVQNLAAVGVPQPVLAASINICEDTLRKHYREELDKGKAVAIYMVAKGLYLDAISGDDKARQLFLTTQAKWSNSLEDTASSAEERAKVVDSKLLETFNLLNAPEQEQEQDNKEDEEDEDLF